LAPRSLWAGGPANAQVAGWLILHSMQLTRQIRHRR
jgi:hypothetical protein